MLRRKGTARAAVSTLVTLAAVLGWASGAEANRPHPHFFDGGTLDWAPNLTTAKQWASARGQLIFVEVGNARCPNCESLCNLIGSPSVRAKMQNAAVGLAPPSGNLHPSVRRLFMNNVPRSGLRVLPWVAFLTAEGEWITGWGGYTDTQKLLSNLDVALARESRAMPRHGSQGAPQAGAVPPAPNAPPAPDTGRKLLLSSKSGEGTCLGGSCGGLFQQNGMCEGGACNAPGMCEGGVCQAPPLAPPPSGRGTSTARGPSTSPPPAQSPSAHRDLAPMLPWVRGAPGAAPKTDRPMASQSDPLHAVGSPDAAFESGAVSLAPNPVAPTGTLPPPAVRRLEHPPTPEYHPSCDAGPLLSGDPDAEMVDWTPRDRIEATGTLRVPPTPIAPSTLRAPAAAPVAQSSEPSRRASVPGTSPLDAVVHAARAGNPQEAERLLYAALRQHANDEDAASGRDALKDWREIGLMPEGSLVRRHLVSRARKYYDGTRWAALFGD